MIAYNIQWLHNLQAQEEIETAFHQNCISKDEKEAADKICSTGFYSPNVFVRIGLAILTTVIVAFSIGLFALITLSNGSEQSLGGLLIFFGAGCYALLEYMVKSRNNYQSGIDDTLLLLAGILIIGAINLLDNISSVTNALLVLIFSGFTVIRFTDRLMAFFATIALLLFIFFLLSEFGDSAKAIAPFVLMVAAAAIYFAVKKILVTKTSILYKNCYTLIETTALICLYAAGNYFVVREISNTVFDMQLNPGENIPFAAIFWFFTISIPVFYLMMGIIKKDIILIRVSLLLIAATIFTIRYYHFILPVETVMIVAGASLIIISYFITRMLKETVAGFTAQSHPYQKQTALQNIEALVIAETVSPEQKESRFGGGSFGGGGASGEF